MPKLYQAPFYTVEELERLEEEQLHFPYSDKYLRYDSLKRQYIPTEALLLKNNIDLEESLQWKGGTMEQELEHISDQIYTYINKRSGSTIETLKYKIARGIRRGMTPFRFRHTFQEVLTKQAKFYADNDDITMHSGIDIVGKQWINKGVLLNEDRNISPIVKTMLFDLGLSWQGSYDREYRYCLGQEDW